MTQKILGQSGTSLADTYDVEGSIVGVDALDAEEVKTVHEMGGTIFSERLAARVLNLSSTALAQNLAFNIGFTTGSIARLLGMAVVTTAASRLVSVSVHITAPPAGDNTDVPIWYWAAASDSSRAISVLIQGTLTALTVLTAAFVQPAIPNLMVGTDQGDGTVSAPTVTMRGLTSGFGAGTVETQLIIYQAFPQVAGLSSKGLPVPSW